LVTPNKTCPPPALAKPTSACRGVRLGGRRLEFDVLALAIDQSFFQSARHSV
jgi:hypothetical protein